VENYQASPKKKLIRGEFPRILSEHMIARYAEKQQLELK
jgi:hypothetical protein